MVTMGIGLHSHYHSDWSGIDRDNLKTKKDGAPYHLCENWPKKSECGRRNVQTCRITGLPGCSGNISVNTCDRCPGISMERFFVAMIIICMLGSLASLGFTFLGGKNNGVVICGVRHFIKSYIFRLCLIERKVWSLIIFAQDAGLNVVLGVLLLISSILYIVSAAQVHTLFNHIDTLRKLLEAAGFELRELQGAKIAAAVK